LTSNDIGKVLLIAIVVVVVVVAVVDQLNSHRMMTTHIFPDI